MDLDALARWQSLHHWSDVDPGPLTDNEKHRRIVRLNDELERERANRDEWLRRVAANSDPVIERIERAIARTLALPAANPEKAS